MEVVAMASTRKQDSAEALTVCGARWDLDQVVKRQERSRMMLQVCRLPILGGLLGLVALAVSTGCSFDDRPKGVPVAGVVSHQGKPVEGADVAFSMGFNEDEMGAGAYGRTDENGRFELAARETSAGIPPGSYRVKITKFHVESGWTPDHDEGVRPKETESMELPSKYASFSSSGLTADVVDGSTNEFEFELTN
jgi:hypothetical protein